MRKVVNRCLASRTGKVVRLWHGKGKRDGQRRTCAGDRRERLGGASAEREGRRDGTVTGLPETDRCLA
jgi:hypothetical protein